MAQAVTKLGQDREYETIYVLRPDLDRQKTEDINGRVSDVIAREGGKLTRIESWGRRRLAYPVQKHSRGVYVYLKYVGRGGLVTELERNLRLVDSVLKYQTVKIADGVVQDSYQVQDEDLKFEHVEPLGEDEMEESRARALGLEEAPRPEGAPEGAAEASSDDSSDEETSDDSEQRQRQDDEESEDEE